MKKFVKELKAKKDHKNNKLQFVEPKYSDFLILKESDSKNPLYNQDSYWIAERFFQGAFVKYNNNYGFISKEDTQNNHLA